MGVPFCGPMEGGSQISDSVRTGIACPSCSEIFCAGSHPPRGSRCYCDRGASCSMTR
ncbi:hypothetical protein BD310DRAFT_170757 [Dichomitus squalens]|uniref:Uncharacterized protein n=1 Tax=Dichomitus squalens TaxID=114155 RepID=A0A4V2K6R2_9APHY|nr:hypothetical protein BD310DRAFT_170757 [Dichomitus squalens]